MELDDYLGGRRKDKDLLVMAHVVCGYPTFEDNLKALQIMDEAGVDLVELQFPFSEPSADGPLFVRANELSLASGTRVSQCFDFMRQVSTRFRFKVLMMGYYNTVFKLGHQRFVEQLAAAGGCGYILPDLPVNEAADLHRHSADAGLAPIMLMAPTNTDQRLAQIAAAGRGFVYAVARKGVTGAQTALNDDLDTFLKRCRAATHLPIGVGFGISSRVDIDYLRGRADIAIIGTAALRAWESGGETGLAHFFNGLLA
ncbi:MAG: tryptophan synthase subunit alpha [Parahaliea sp.]